MHIPLFIVPLHSTNVERKENSYYAAIAFITNLPHWKHVKESQFWERSMSGEGVGQPDLIDETLVYLSEKNYPDSCSSNRKWQIRKKAEKFVLNDGEL